MYWGRPHKSEQDARGFRYVGRRKGSGHGPVQLDGVVLCNLPGRSLSLIDCDWCFCGSLCRVIDRVCSNACKFVCGVSGRLIGSGIGRPCSAFVNSLNSLEIVIVRLPRLLDHIPFCGCPPKSTPPPWLCWRWSDACLFCYLGRRCPFPVEMKL